MFCLVLLKAYVNVENYQIIDIKKEKYLKKDNIDIYIVIRYHILGK